MDVILSAGRKTWNLGPRNILDSFFDTVACRLEPKGRASRFPHVLDDLKRGRLIAANAAAAIHELDTIGLELRALPTARILWVGAQPQPNGSANAYERLDALNGEPFPQILRQAAEQAQAFGEPVTLTSPGETARAFWVLVCIFLTGLIWALFGYSLFPR